MLDMRDVQEWQWKVLNLELQEDLRHDNRDQSDVQF